MLQVKRYMHIVTALLLLCAFNLAASAQDNPIPCPPAPGFANGGFETSSESSSGCVWTTSTFAIQKTRPMNEGCVPGWIAPNGTPNLFRQVFGLFPATPASGSVFAGLGTSASPCFNEVMAANVSLDPGYSYELSFAYRATTSSSVPGSIINPFNGSVIITSGLANDGSSAGLEPCLVPSGNTVISIPNINTTTWTTASVTFTPAAGQNQIAFVPAMSSGTGTSYWLIDNVQLRRCTPCKASFKTIYCAQPNSCVYTFYNTSTASFGASITDYEWTVTALDDPEQAVFTSHDKHLVFTPSCNGTYKICLKIRDSKGCSSEYCEIIEVNCTVCKCVAGPNPCEAVPHDTIRDEKKFVEIKAEAAKPAYRVFPNPAKNYFRLEYKAENSQPARLLVVNTAGREVVSRNLDNRPGAVQSIRVAQLQKGLYFVKVMQGGTVVFSDKVLITD